MLFDIYNIFGINKSEARGFRILLTQSLFLGVFYGALEIAASSLFLDYFPASDITKAYAISGLTGIFLTTIYSYIHERISFTKVSVINLLFLIFILIFLRISFYYLNVKILVFTLFVLMGPLRIIALTGFWGNVSRLYDLQKGKKVFGIIDNGWIVGIILSSYFITFLMQHNFHSRNLLLISILSILITLILQIIINKNYNLENQIFTDKNELGSEDRFRNQIKKPFIFLMSLFVFLSLMTAFFIHFIFLNTTKIQYPGSVEFSVFFGFFNGTMMVFIIILKSFAYNKLVKTYGLKTTLVLSPVILLIFIILASFTSNYLSSQTATSGFIIFFVIVALSKIFSAAFKESIENPSFKILYQSLDKKIRYNIQARIDGNINEISAFLSGLLLVFLSEVLKFKTDYFIFFSIFILIIWLFVSLRLYNYYKLNLKTALINIAYLKNKDNNHSDVLTFNNYKENNHTEIRLAGKSKLNYNQIEKLSESSSYDDRLLAISNIIDKNDVKYVHIINKLIQDEIIEVSIKALYSATQKYNENTISIIIKLLKNSELSEIAESTLLKIGKPALENLIHIFYSSDTTVSDKIKILRVIARFKSEKSFHFLTENLAFKNRTILYHTLLALLEIKNELPENYKFLIYKAIEEHIGLIGWNIAAMYVIENNNAHKYLKEAFNDELSDNYKILFLLLSIVYDAKTIEYVEENVKTMTLEGIGYAIELLDQFVDDNLKPKLFPIFENISKFYKIKALENYYPITILNYIDLLHLIINRDSNLVFPWTKACAILQLIKIPNYYISNTLVAQLFNYEPLLHEVAALSMYSLNATKYKQCFERLPEKIKTNLKFIEDKNISYISTFDSVILLKDINFVKNLTYNQLYKLICAGYQKVFNTSELFYNIDNKYFVIIFKGYLNIYIEKKLAKQYESVSIVPLFHYKEKNDYMVFEIEANSIVLFIDKENILNLFIEDEGIKNELLQNFEILNELETQIIK